jgi:hypothetical protein
MLNYYSMKLSIQNTGVATSGYAQPPPVLGQQEGAAIVSAFAGGNGQPPVASGDLNNPSSAPTVLGGGKV